MCYVYTTDYTVQHTWFTPGGAQEQLVLNIPTTALLCCWVDFFDYEASAFYNMWLVNKITHMTPSLELCGHSVFQLPSPSWFMCIEF